MKNLEFKNEHHEVAIDMLARDTWKQDKRILVAKREKFSFQDKGNGYIVVEFNAYNKTIVKAYSIKDIIRHYKHWILRDKPRWQYQALIYFKRTYTWNKSRVLATLPYISLEKIKEYGFSF